MTKYSVKPCRLCAKSFDSDDWNEIVKYSRKLCDQEIPHYIVDNEFAIRCPMCGAKPWKV